MVKKGMVVFVILVWLVVAVFATIAISHYVKVRRFQKKAYGISAEYYKNRKKLDEIALDFNAEYDRLMDGASKRENSDKPGYTQALASKMNDLAEIGQMGYEADLELQKTYGDLLKAREDRDSEKLDLIQNRLQNMETKIEKVKKKLDEFKKSA